MRFLTPFSESLFAAVRYYMAIDKRIALEFIKTVDEAQDNIARFPKIGKLSGKYREFRLKKFPYNYCYREDLTGELVAIVLFHHKQKEHRVD